MLEIGYIIKVDHFLQFSFFFIKYEEKKVALKRGVNLKPCKIEMNAHRDLKLGLKSLEIDFVN